MYVQSIEVRRYFVNEIFPNILRFLKISFYHNYLTTHINDKLRYTGTVFKYFRFNFVFLFSIKSNLYTVQNFSTKDLMQKKEYVFPPGIEPGTFRVLGGCDNHYTTETRLCVNFSTSLLTRILNFHLKNFLNLFIAWPYMILTLI